MTTPADVPTDEEAFTACLAGRPVPEGAQGLTAFTDAVRASATEPGRPNAALAELLATGLLVPTQEPSRGTAGRPARTSRKRPHVLISTLTAKFAAAGAVAKAAAAGGVVAVALTGAATAGALTSEPTSVETTSVSDESTAPQSDPSATPQSDPTEPTTDPAGEQTEAPTDAEPTTLPVPTPTTSDPGTVVLDDPDEAPVPDTDAPAEPAYSNHGQRVGEAARDSVPNRGQMPTVAHHNRDQRRAERAAPAEEPALQPAVEAPVVDEPAPVAPHPGKGNGNGNGKNGK